MTSNLQCIVIGDGWAALGAVGFQALRGNSVRWISGSGTRLAAPLPAVESGAGAEAWRELALGFGIDIGSAEPGCFVREFKNKAFREPAWARSPTLEQSDDASSGDGQPAQLRKACDRFFAGTEEVRFGNLTLSELEEALRGAILAHPLVTRTEALPITAVEAEGGTVQAIRLGSGERIECKDVFFADSWSELPRIAGIPRAPSFVRKREPVGAIQASFTHTVPVGADCLEGFFGTLPQPADTQESRNVWGHFSSDGLRSIWTLCLSSEETEDNHAIAGRLRKMKSTLEKMFSSSPWVSAREDGSRSFLATVSEERVRFAESLVFSMGTSPKALPEVPELAGLRFLTDGYGPSAAMAQARSLFS